MDTARTIRVLLIEDNPGDARIFRKLLSLATAATFDLEGADRLATGLERLKRGGIDIIVSDLNLPDSSGIETFRTLSAQANEMPIIVLTGVYLEDELGIQTVKEGAQDYLTKDGLTSAVLSRTILFAIERKQMSMVRKSEQEFRALAVNSPDVIVRFDRQLRHTYANPAAAIVYGRPPRDIIGKTDAELGRDPEQVASWEGRYRRVFETGKPEQMEFRLLSPRGKKRHFDTRIVPELNERGDVVSLLAISRDITQLKEAERRSSEAMEEAKRRAEQAEEGRTVLETIMSNIPEGIMITDTEGNIRMISLYMARIIGVRQTGAIGQSSDIIEAKLSAARSMPAIRQEYPIVRALKRGETILAEERTVHVADGADMPVLINAGPIRSGDGRIIGALASWRDITERKKMEDILRRDEYELRTLVDNSPDLIFRLNRQKRYVFVNPAYERVTGIPKEQFTDKTNSDLGMPLQLVEFWKSAVEKVFEGGREHSIEFDMTSFFGKRCFFARLIPEFVKSGLVETVLVIARDVTERRKAEEQIRYISFHDEVTGLFNRAFFEEELRRVDTGRALPVSIIMGDVNNLKLSNDVFGHEEGDRLLKTLADIIRKACRQEDIVARWGGDEFAVILPGTDFETADAACGRIKQIARESKGSAMQPSVALGVATKENREQNIYQSVRQAEERMYRNKLDESNVNEHRVYDALFERARERSRDLGVHLDRSYALADEFGRTLSLSESQMDDLRLLIRLHDIGDAAMPQEILLKPGPLTHQEREIMKKHAEAGFRIVKTFADTARISDEVLAHGERWDGAGYPRGLKEKEIPYLARVFQIIDVFDVMTHARPYAGASTREEAAEELRRNAGRQFDPGLAEIFLAAIAQRAAAAD